MKRAIFSLNFALALCLFTTSVRGDTITWATGNSGNWSNPANWNPNEVPGPSDTALITTSGNYTVIVDTNTSVNILVLGSSDTTTQTVVLNGQSLSIDQSATVNTNAIVNLNSSTLFFDPYGNSIIYGTLNCSSSTLGSVLTVASNGIVNFLGGSNPVDLTACTLTNCGTVTWSNVDLECFESQVYNYGLWDALSDNTFYGGDFGCTFNNYGTVRKDGGSSITAFDSATTFINTGTVDVETNEITIAYGSGGGLFNTASNAILSMEFQLIGDTTFTGPGLVGGFLVGYSGDNSGVIHGSLNFYNGSLAGTLTIANNAVANLVGVTGANQPIDFSALTLTNCGTVVWGNVDLEGFESQVYNYGLWEAQTDNTFYGGDFGTPFNNYGTVRKDGGTLTSTFDNYTTFNNFGTVDVEASQININYGSGGGTFNTASNDIVWLGIGDGFTLSGCTTFTGSGLVGGNLYGYPVGTIRGSLNFYYGSLAGTLTVASNSVANLVGINGQSSAINLNGITLTNCGTVTWNNIDLECSSAQIYNYGLWDAQSDNTFFGGNESTFNNYGIVRKDGGTATTVFDDYTTFNNSGTVDVEASQININYGSGGGTFNTASNDIVWLGIGDGFTLSGCTTFTGPGLVGGNLYGYPVATIRGSLNFYTGSLGGRLTVASNAVANLIGIPGANSPLNLSSLTLTNCGTVTWTNLDLQGNSTEIYNYGLWCAQAFNTFAGGNGSTFNNYGTLRKDAYTASTFDGALTFNNYGRTDIQAGLLNLEGNNYSLTNGLLNFGFIGGQGSQNSVISFYNNTAMLSGRLSVNFEKGYTPKAGDYARLMLYYSETGSFSSIGLPQLPAGLSWQVNYTNFDCTVSIVASSFPLSEGLTASGTSTSLTWYGLSGQTYQVQCSTNLAPVVWVNLGDPIAGTNGPITVLDSFLASPQKFYRIESQ